MPVDRPLDELTAELVEMLGHPNPRLREDIAYPLLTTWVDQGVYDDLLSGLGDGIVPGLRYGLGHDGDVSVIRRCYSALMLAEIIGRDNTQLLSAAAVLRLGRPGHQLVRARAGPPRLDSRAGLGARHRARRRPPRGSGPLAHFGRLELTVLLDVIADRVLTPTAYIWRHGEDDRLAFAVMALLHRNALDTTRRAVAEATRRGHPAAAARAAPLSEWPSAAAFNTSALPARPAPAAGARRSRPRRTSRTTQSCSPSSRRTAPT